MKKKENIVIPFRLVDIETQQWAVIPENFSKEDNETQISFSFSFSVIPNGKMIMVVPRVGLLQKEKEFAILEVAFLYNIKEDAWHKMIEDNLFTIPKALKEHFLIIAVGTMRGILYEKTQAGKTGIDKIVYPTIDVATDTGDDLVFDLSKEE